MAGKERQQAALLRRQLVSDWSDGAAATDLLRCINFLSLMHKASCFTVRAYGSASTLMMCQATMVTQSPLFLVHQAEVCIDGTILASHALLQGS